VLGAAMVLRLSNANDYLDGNIAFIAVQANLLATKAIDLF